MAATVAPTGRAVRMTGLKKPRPLRKVADTAVQETTEVEKKLDNLNLRESNVKPKTDNQPEPVQLKEKNNNNAPATSFTAIVDVGGEKLVLASTNMKTILKAASLLALHMEGELLHLDGDASETCLETVEKRTNPQPPPPKVNRNIRRPKREELQSFMPELPDLGRPDKSTKSQHFFEDCNDFDRSAGRVTNAPREATVHEARPKSIQYSVKDLLMLSRQPHSKVQPRNWALIRDAFPELVSQEERYFEPFDLKACQPDALGRSKVTPDQHGYHRDTGVSYPHSDVRKNSERFLSTD